MANNKSILESIAGSLGQLTGAGGVADLASKFASFVKQTDSLTKSTTRLGASFPNVAKTLGPELGKLAGRNTELENAIDLMDQSLSINNQQLKLLTLQTKVNGGDTKGLQRVLRQSVVTGNLSNENLGSFSERIMKLRDTYQISTDNLVEAFAKTANNLDLAFFGVGKSFSEALMEFEGKFGKGSADLFEKFSSQLLNPEFFGKSMQFGLQDEIARLTKSGATGAEVQSALLDTVRELQPRIQQMKDSLGNLPDSKKLEMLGQYFGSKDIVVLAEAISKLQPKEVVPGGPAKDQFANLQTAIDKATSEIMKLAEKVVPFLVDNMGTVVKALQFLGVIIIQRTLSRGLVSLATTLRTGPLASIARIIPGIVRFLGPMGIALGLIMTFWPQIKKLFGMVEDQDDEDVAEKKKAAEDERRRLSEDRKKAMAEAKAALDYKTNNYLQLQSNSLNATMNGIIFGNDLAKKTLDMSSQQVAALNKLVTVIMSNSNRGQAPVPAGVR
jgi:hypothetical protein